MYRLFSIFLCLFLTFSLTAQESPKPELSKKELRKYHRKLKKLNRSLKKRTVKLKDLLAKQGFQLNPLGELSKVSEAQADSLALDPNALANGGFGQLDQIQDKIPQTDSLVAIESPLPGLNGLQSPLSQTDSINNLQNPLQGFDNKVRGLLPNGGKLNQLKNKLPGTDSLGLNTGLSSKLKGLNGNVQLPDSLKTFNNPLPNLNGKFNDLLPDSLSGNRFNSLQNLNSKLKGLVPDSVSNSPLNALQKLGLGSLPSDSLGLDLPGVNLSGLQQRIPGLDSLGFLQNIKGKLPVNNLSGLNKGLPASVGNTNGLVPSVPGNMLGSLAPNIEGLDKVQGLSQELDQLKRKLKVGQQLTGNNPDLTGTISETMMELTDMEYELKDLEALKGQMKSFKLDSASLQKYLGPLGGDLDKIKGQVGEYKSMLDGYKAELVDWDKKLEDEILKLEEVQGLAKIVEKPTSNPMAKMEEAQKTLEKGFQSKEYVNEIIKQRLDKLIKEKGPEAVTQRLTDAHESMAEYKRKYDELQDIKDLPKKKSNPLRGKPLGERLAFGGNLQINRQKPLTLDAGVELAYRFTPNSELGVGGAYRFKLEKGANLGTVTDLLNVRSFYHHQIWRSVGIQANYEFNYGLPRTEQVVEGLSKQWTQSGLIGLRNEQPFLKNIGGYLTMQYDLFHKPESPNPKWVFRFGIRLK